ncbi:MAG TPA: RNA polymerase sigma factor [Vicinamibacterales bacterium]
MDRETELELVGRLRHGDPEAFDVVHAAFNARLYNFLARLSNRRDVAEDLLEEAWLRLVVHAPRLRQDTRLGPWLFTVARNLHTSYCRSRLLEDSHAAGLLGLWPCGSPGPSPFEEAQASEVQRRIATALASLPAAYREALLLVAVEGLRPAEAAEVCGVTGEAMRQRLSRARGLLARRLSDAEAPGLTALNEATT